MDSAASILTPEQRALYADDLAAGVPEEVIAEWDRSLDEYITEWAKQVGAGALKQKQNWD